MTEKLRLSQEEIDERNRISSIWFSLRKDTPATFWYKSCKSPLEYDSVKNLVAKALDLDPNDTYTPLATWFMRLGKVDEQLSFVIPYPAPKLSSLQTGEIYAPWAGIDQVLIWNPKTDFFEIMGDPQAQIFGGFPETDRGTQQNMVFSHPKRFLQEWARNIAIQQEHIRIRQNQKWTSIPDELDVCPGALIVGELSKIRWPIHAMPRDLVGVDVDNRAVNQSILKSANFPFVR